tara:strand:+ start:2882 stop:3061 length:180 start_codon:yes stop_codon:yes gene_type:complete
MRQVTITLDQAKIAAKCVEHSIDFVQDVDVGFLELAVFNLQRQELLARLKRAIQNAEAL